MFLIFISRRDAMGEGFGTAIGDGYLATIVLRMS